MKFRFASIIALLTILIFSPEAHVSGTVRTSAISGLVYVESSVGMKIPMQGHEKAANKANDGRIALSKSELAKVAKHLADTLTAEGFETVKPGDLLPIEKKFQIFEPGTAGAMKFPSHAITDEMTKATGKRGYVKFATDPIIVLRFKAIPKVSELRKIEERLKGSL